MGTRFTKSDAQATLERAIRDLETTERHVKKRGWHATGSYIESARRYLNDAVGALPATQRRRGAE